MKCFACGADKNLSAKSVYPYPEDESLTDEPIVQLLPIEVQGTNDRPDGGWDFRVGFLCHECWHRLEAGGGIDMWISEAAWEWLKPAVPFAQLPRVKKNAKGNPEWNAAKYEE